MTRVLIIGSASDDKFIGNSLRECKKLDNSIHFDYFANSTKTDTPFRNVIDNFSFVSHHYPVLLYTIPKVRGYCNQQDLLKSLQSYVQKCEREGIHYDYCHIYFLNPIYVKVVDALKRVASRLILTPWGSDILRAKNRDIVKLRELAQKSDIITSPQGSRFKADVSHILRVPECKFYDLSFGVATIDEMLKMKDVDAIQAKHILGLDDKYCIVIGYNGNPAHHHVNVLKALAKVKKYLPLNYIVILPMTYGANVKYITEVERLLKQEQINYKLFTSYMSNETVVFLRKATDLFIHAQSTDANSGTIAEYLLCKKKVINPTWLSYPHHEKYGNPFYTFSSFSDLSRVIVEAIQTKETIVPDQLVQDIESCSWAIKAKDWVELYMRRD